jgi:hypothetical protein
MRKLRIILAVLLFSLAPELLRANWGSTAGGSVATGSFHAFGTAQIKMQREDLRIRLYRDRAKVEIDYLLHNTGPAVDVRAGFPSLGVVTPNEARHEIESYAISADGNSVPYHVEKGDPKPLKALFDAKFMNLLDTTDQEHGADENRMLLEWFTSTVHFDHGQTRRIHIRYDSLYAHCSGGYSDDGDSCDDRFAYALSTGAAWKGPIVSGSVTIESVTIPAARLILSPVGRFRRQGSSFTWQFRNLKPTPDDDILINLNNHASTIAEYVGGTDSTPPRINYYTLEAEKYFYLNRNFTAHGDSASPDYSASQLSDGESEKEWRTAHAPGIADALTLDITGQAHVDQIGIIPGCGANEQEWFSHARIRDVDVTVNDTYKYKAVLPDEFTFAWHDSHKAYEWIDLPSYPNNAEKIQLVIRGVYPGSSDQVTCIGKVMLRQWMESRPAIKSGVDGHELP